MGVIMKKKKWQQLYEKKMVGLRTLEYICETWPKAFVKMWDRNSEHKALEIGIHQEIWEHFKQKVKWQYDITMAMSLYCNSPKYHKAMLTVGKSRVALDGKAVGKIEECDVYHHRLGLLNWIINNQLGRRNLTNEEKSYLRGLEYENAKSRHGGDRKSSGKSCHLKFEKTRDEIAEKHNVSSRTIENDSKFATGVNAIASVAPDKKDEILQGKSDFTKKDIADFAQIEKEKQEAIEKAKAIEVDLFQEREKHASEVERIKAESEAKAQQLAKEMLQKKEEERQRKLAEKREAQRKRIEAISQNDTKLPEKKYRVIYADPPWQYEHPVSESRRIENQYPTMSLEDICNLKVKEITHEKAILFLWVTSPMLKNGITVLESWGFEYKTNAVWDKQVIGMGYFFRQQHEILLVGIKGVFPTPVIEGRVSSVFSIKRERHSEKPIEIAQTIEKMYPELSKIELFCRNPRPGWDVWGNEI